MSEERIYKIEELECGETDYALFVSFTLSVTDRGAIIKHEIKRTRDGKLFASDKRVDYRYASQLNEDQKKKMIEILEERAKHEEIPAVLHTAKMFAELEYKV